MAGEAVGVIHPVASRRRNPLWTIYEYLAMVLGLSFLGLLCLLWLPFAMILRPFLRGAKGRRFGQRIISLGFRLYIGFLQLACASHFDLAAIDRLRHESPRVLIANHPSLLDAVMIVSRLPHVVCVMKAGLMRNILLGSAARLAGYIPNTGPLEIILQAGRALDEGAHVLLFPEGSRTDRHPLNAFSNSAALIARRSRTPIQSLLIRFSSASDQPYLGKGWPLWRKPELPMYWAIEPDRSFEPPQAGGDAAGGSDRNVAVLTACMEAHLRQQLNAVHHARHAS